MRFLLCLALAACSSPLKAQVALNSYTGRYEIAPHNAVPQLNPLRAILNWQVQALSQNSTHSKENGRWRLGIQFPDSTNIVKNGKWRLLMRGSRLIPIRVSGIIHGDAEITARRGGLVRDASVGDQVARHSTARGTAAAPSQQTNASKEQSGESGTRYRTGNANRSDESAHNAEIAEGQVTSQKRSPAITACKP